MTENRYIVKKVSLTETFRRIPAGKPIVFDCREAGTFGSAKAAVSRLNSAADREVYTISTDDNGATYTILRKE